MQSRDTPGRDPPLQPRMGAREGTFGSRYLSGRRSPNTVGEDRGDSVRFVRLSGRQRRRAGDAFADVAVVGLAVAQPDVADQGIRRDFEV
jgi:hypothetical protein